MANCALLQSQPVFPQIKICLEIKHSTPWAKIPKVLYAWAWAFPLWKFVMHYEITSGNHPESTGMAGETHYFPCFAALL